MSIPSAVLTGWWLTPRPRMKRPSVASPIRADLDAARRGPHQLGRRHHVVVDLGGEDRVEAGVLGLPRDRGYLAGAPPHPRNDG
jgi:hypothetical protein